MSEVTYASFEKVPGVRYKAYVDDVTSSALASVGARYRRDYTALLAQPYYEFKFAPRSASVYEREPFAVMNRHRRIVFYRRPREFADVEFPWTPFTYARPRILFFNANTNRPAFVVDIVSTSTSGGATGYVVVEAAP